jgi:SCY1-like protein 1
VDSVFVNEMGEWVVGGFELTTQKDQDTVLFSMGSLLPGSSRNAPPEVTKDGWQITQRLPLSVDSWQFGKLISEVFNGLGSNLVASGSRGDIPVKLFRVQQMLVNHNPRQRIAIPKLVANNEAMQGFDTDLTALSDALKTLQMADEYHFNEFIDSIDSIGHLFPKAFLHYKLIPEVCKGVEVGKGGVKGLTCIIRLAKNLSADDFQRLVSPLIVSMFSNPNRLIRMELLTALPDYIGSLSKKVVSDKIFQHLATGFNDTEPAIREHTLKSITLIIDKLTDRQINQELLRLLAKTQNDQQADIRANTTILLGIIAGKFSPSSRPGVLVAAFGRALKDPHVPSRVAALRALAATAEYFSPEDSASKIMGSLCPSLLDNNKSVRDLAKSTLEIFLDKIGTASRDLDSKQADDISDTGSSPASEPSLKKNWGIGIGGAFLGYSQTPPPLPETGSRDTADLQLNKKAASTTHLPSSGGSTWDTDDGGWGNFGSTDSTITKTSAPSKSLKLESKKSFSSGWGNLSSRNNTSISKIEKKVSKLALQPQDGADGWGDSWFNDEDAFTDVSTTAIKAPAKKISLEPDGGAEDGWGDW